MRVLVCGSRDLGRHEPNAAAAWERAIRSRLSELSPTLVIHGDCPTGADAMADQWAIDTGVEVDRYPADWDRHGRAAGPIRNAYMVALKPDRVLAFTPNLDHSRGTRNCVQLALQAGLVVEMICNPEGQ